MSGCDFQLTTHRADRGTTVQIRGVWLALALSLVIHIGAGYFAGGVVMEANGPAGRSTLLASSGPLMTLDFEPPPDATPPSPPPPALAAQPPEPEPVAPPPPEPDKKLKLGIAESDQSSPNWLGFKDPTPHSAPKSEVEQPALDPNAGRPGEPSAPTPPTPPSPADPLESPAQLPPPMAHPALPEEVRPTPPAMEPTPPPTPVEPRPSPTMPETPPPAPPPPTQISPTTPPGEAPEMIEAQRPRLGDPEPSPEPPAAPKADPAAAPDPSHPALAEGFVGPLPRELVALLEAWRPRGKGATDGVPNSAADRAREATLPRAPSPTGARPLPAQPSRPPVPGGPATSAMRPTPPNTPSGNNADSAAEQSEKQSDATALTETINIRPGRPAASQGLEIITRRPIFTRLTRVVSSLKNYPLVRITFSRSGVVVKVELLESSGDPDIDDPVINAAYKWTARGKDLDDLPNENSTHSINVRIIL